MNNDIEFVKFQKWDRNEKWMETWKKKSKKQIWICLTLNETNRTVKYVKCDAFAYSTK